MPERPEKRGRPRKWTGPIAEWIIASKIRVDKLADELEVDHSTVYCWLRGVQYPSLSKAKAIAEIARRSGSSRKLTLEDILDPRGNEPSTRRGQSHGVLPRPTPEIRDRRLATATK